MTVAELLAWVVAIVMIFCALAAYAAVAVASTQDKWYGTNDKGKCTDSPTSSDANVPANNNAAPGKRDLRLGSHLAQQPDSSCEA